MGTTDHGSHDNTIRSGMAVARCDVQTCAAESWCLSGVSRCFGHRAKGAIHMPSV